MTRASVYELTLSNSQRGWCAISDLHLSEHMPETMAKFEWFCAHIAPQYDALFILGDLFEYWVGDDAADFRFFGLSLKRFDGSGYEISEMHVCCSI